MNVVDGIQKILRQFSPQWVSMVLDLIASIQTYVKQDSPEGPYEILEYEFNMELLDTRGHAARWTKRQRVKFLQDHVIAFEDYAWGDGNVLVGYTCSPGFVADRYREGDRWNVLISLRESKYRGDIQDFYMRSQPQDAFMGKEEWCQIEMQHRTRSARLSVVFPKKRHCTEAVLVERHRDRTTHLDGSIFTILPDGRQLLTWETMEPRRFETYTIKWTW